MKHDRTTLTIETEQTEQILDITDDVRDIIKDTSIVDGMVSVFPLHTSSAVFINDSDPHLMDDLRELLGDLIPEQHQYQHNSVDPKENATAHLKSIITGHHVTIPLTEQSFDFGRYHTLYYAEFDGQRPKEILVKTIGDTG